MLLPRPQQVLFRPETYGDSTADEFARAQPYPGQLWHVHDSSLSNGLTVIGSLAGTLAATQSPAATRLLAKLAQEAAPAISHALWRILAAAAAAAASTPKSVTNMYSLAALCLRALRPIVMASYASARHIDLRGSAALASCSLTHPGGVPPLPMRRMRSTLR